MTEPAAYPPPQASPQPPPLVPVNRRTPAGWIVAIVGFALLFSVVLPVAVLASETTRPSVEGEELSLMFGTVQAPPGWLVSIPSSSLGQPALETRNVRVEFTSGLWEGSTESLLERIVDLNLDDPATADIPAVEEPEDRTDRTVHRIPYAGDQRQGDLYVIRELSVVAVMTVRGDPEAVEAAQAQLDAMIDSLELEELDLSLEELEEVDL